MISDRSEPVTLGEKAYAMLVKRITRLEIEPGSVLAEKQLIEELSIGRTPIREALQRLAIEGLVTHLHHRGMFVSEITYANVQEIYEFRSLVDGHACRLAAERATAEQARELNDCHAALVKATETDDVDEYVKYDRRFHHILATAAQNSFLAETIPRIFNLHLRLWFYISLRVASSWHAMAEPHKAMTREVALAVANKDGERAELAMKSYILQRQLDLRGTVF